MEKRSFDRYIFGKRLFSSLVQDLLLGFLGVGPRVNPKLSEISSILVFFGSFFSILALKV